MNQKDVDSLMERNAHPNDTPLCPKCGNAVERYQQAEAELARIRGVLADDALMQSTADKCYDEDIMEHDMPISAIGRYRAAVMREGQLVEMKEIRGGK